MAIYVPELDGVVWSATQIKYLNHLANNEEEMGQFVRNDLNALELKQNLTPHLFGLLRTKYQTIPQNPVNFVADDYLYSSSAILNFENSEPNIKSSFDDMYNKGVSILGASFAFKFVGNYSKSVVIAAARHIIDVQNDKSRIPVFVIHGSPGKGKTRCLLEICSKFVSEKDSLHLFVTFNHLTYFSRNELKFTPESWISLRLLFAYTLHKCDNWDTFLAVFMSQNSNRNRELSCSISKVTDFLLRIYQKKKIVIYIDECLKPFNMSLCDSVKIMSMMKSVWMLQGSDFKSVFSCFATGFLKEIKFTSGSNRAIIKYCLQSWTEEEAIEVVRSIFIENVQLNELQAENIDDMIFPFVASLGGIPRAYQLLKDCIDSFRERKIAFHAKSIFFYVARKISEYYGKDAFSDEFMLQSLCGDHFESDVKINSNGAMLSGILHNGYLDSESMNNNEEILFPCCPCISLVRLVAHCPSHEVLKRLVMSSFQSHRNLFEELIRCRLLLQFQLWKHRHTKSIMLAELFRYMKLISGNFSVEIDFSGFSDIGEDVNFDNVPTPNQISSNYNNYFRMFVPYRSNEVGVDTIVFAPRIDMSPIAILIQNKNWNSQFGGSNLTDAIIKAFMHVNSHGWALDDIFLVFINYATSPAYIWDATKAAPDDLKQFKDAKFNVGIIGFESNFSNGNFLNWCGPTTSNLVKNYLKIEGSSKVDVTKFSVENEDGIGFEKILTLKKALEDSKELKKKKS